MGVGLGAGSFDEVDDEELVALDVNGMAKDLVGAGRLNGRSLAERF